MQNSRNARKRARRRKRALAIFIILVLFVAVVLLFVAIGRYLLRDVLGTGAAADISQSETLPEETPQPEEEVSAAESGSFLQPMSADTDWNRSDYSVRTIDTTVQAQDDGTTAMDFRLAAQPACGVVDMSYYDTVTFVGDSLTQGLQLYTTGIPNASYCAYIGIGPNTIVNGGTGKRLDGQQENCWDAILATNPDAIYILLGTNVLTGTGGQESYLAYYDKLLDMILEAKPGITIYVQSITPVRPDVASRKPGLNRARLMAINDEVAAMALSKGCYFIDLWEALADENGDLIADYAAKDGIHMQPAGYQAWVDYLRRHTAYTPGVAYEAGTSYYIER